jgi:hypothetical protein
VGGRGSDHGDWTGTRVTWWDGQAKKAEKKGHSEWGGRREIRPSDEPGAGVMLEPSRAGKNTVPGECPGGSGPGRWTVSI